MVSFFKAFLNEVAMEKQMMNKQVTTTKTRKERKWYEKTKQWQDKLHKSGLAQSALMKQYPDITNSILQLPL